MSTGNFVIIFALLALIYHLGPWRPGRVSGAGFDDMMDVGIANWDREVIGARKPVLVFFHSPSSRDCQQLYPVISSVHESLRGRLKVARVNLEENASLAMRYRIESIPALMVFESGLLSETLSSEVVVSHNGLKGELLDYCNDAF